MTIEIKEIEEFKQIKPLIIEMHNLLIKNSSIKKWLSTNEVADYIGYSRDSIDRFVKTKEFEIDVHYYVRKGKRIFSKEALDLWVIGEDLISEKMKNDINRKIKEVAEIYSAA